MKGKKMAIRVRLDEILKEKGMSQIALSEASEVPPGSIRQLYNNTASRYDKKTLEKIMNTLGITLAELIITEEV